MAASDVLSWSGLDISFQRLGRSAWSSRGVLRSWAQAPWERLPDGDLAVACLPGDAVWFGLTATGSAARVRFESRNGLWVRELDVPPDWQLGWIQTARRKRPIALRSGCQSASFVLSVRCPKAARPNALAILLLAPDAWRRLIGPLQLDPAEEPEPVGLYSRIMPARGERSG